MPPVEQPPAVRDSCEVAQLASETAVSVNAWAVARPGLQDSLVHYTEGSLQLDSLIENSEESKQLGPHQLG